MNEIVRFSEDGATLRAELLQEIDHHSAKPVREQTDKMLFKLSPDVLELDFSAVRFMDSSGIGLIIGRAEIAASLGCELRLKGLSAQLMRIVRLSGIERIRNITII